MSLEAVRAELRQAHRDGDIRVFDESSATVSEAAHAIGTEPARIAKTIAIADESVAEGEPPRALLVVLAGDARLASGAVKRRFGFKPHMLPPDDVEPLTGHRIGGVCPFANPASATVWLDESLRRFDVVWPACGSANSAIGLTLSDLEVLSGAAGWVDVGKDWRDESESEERA
jgi:prolyl-tRNA editing enzyme YbaK/EbsC (Cys-tRNA(Pro) deacylase)